MRLSKLLLIKKKKKTRALLQNALVIVQLLSFSLSFPFFFLIARKERVKHSIVSKSLHPMDCSPPGSFVHGTFFPRQEYWSGLPLPSPGDLPDPGIEPMSPAWQVDSLPLSHLGRSCLLPELNQNAKVIEVLFAGKKIKRILSCFSGHLLGTLNPWEPFKQARVVSAEFPQ